MPSDEIVAVRGEWEQDGFRMFVEADRTHAFRILDVEAMRALIEVAELLKEQVADHDREMIAYQTASPEERATVLYGRDGPVDWAERERERADLGRKAERERA